MVNQYGQTDITQALLAQGTSPSPYKTPLGQAARLGGIALAEWGKRKQADKSRNALADALASLNGGSLTGEGPTTDAAGRAPIGDPQMLARLLSDPNNAHIGQALLGQMLKPPAERYETLRDEQGRPYGQRNTVTGQVEAFPKSPYAQDPYNLSPGQQRFDGEGNLIASVPAKRNEPAGYRVNNGRLEIIPGGPADPAVIAAQKRAGDSNLVPVPGIGLFNRSTNQYVNFGGSAPPPKGGDVQFPDSDRPGGNLPPTVAAKVAEAEAKKAIDELAKMRTDLSPIRDTMKMAERFEQLLEVQDTGGLLRKLPGAGTVESIWDAEAGEMVQLTDKITPLMRNGFPGAASDSDRRMFRGAAFGLDKLPEVNRNIIIAMKTSGQLAQDRFAFMEKYFEKQGSLRGADELWREYLNANPIFDPNGNPSAPTLNTDRQSWREYFTPEKRRKNDGALSPAEREEYERLRRELAQ